MKSLRVLNHYGKKINHTPWFQRAPQKKQQISMKRIYCSRVSSASQLFSRIVFLKSRFSLAVPFQFLSKQLPHFERFDFKQGNNAQDFWPFHSCKFFGLWSTLHQSHPKTHAWCRSKSGTVFLLGYQAFVSRFHYLWYGKIQFLHYALSNRCFYYRYTSISETLMLITSIGFIRLAFSQTFFIQKGKAFLPSFERYAS